jgi:hypothetical protein
MGISGTDKALMYALGGIARGGATRGGYTSGGAFVFFGGAHLGFGRLPGHEAQHIGVLYGTLTVTDNLDEAPNRCTFGVNNWVPTLGWEVVLTLGSKNNLQRLFAGHIVDTNQRYALKPANLQCDVSCVDYTWQLGFALVTERYTNQSATVIAQDLIAKYGAANGFTAANVAAGLPTLDEITYTNEPLPEAFTRLARRIGGYWYVDYNKSVHFFIASEVLNGAPVDLTATHPSLANVTAEIDTTQALTRVYVEGRGAKLLSNVALGDTMLPLEAVDMFAVAGDVFLKASFQGSEGGAQHLNYGGVVAGGAGTLVGPGVGPSAAPTLNVSSGAGLGTGPYQYAVTFTTGAGESLPSPIGSVTTGVVASPSAAPTVGVPTVGAGPDAGTHQYAVSFITTTGETTPSPLSAVVTTGAPSIPNPTTVPTGSTPPNNYFADLIENGSYKIKYAYATTFGSPTPINVTLASPPSAVIKANNTAGDPQNAAIQTSVPCSANPSVQYVHVYRTTNGGATFYNSGLFANVPGTFINYAGTDKDATLVGEAPEPAANSTPPLSVVPLSAIPLGGPTVTGRRIYRTAAGGAQLKLVTTLADNVTTTFSDTVTDAALGANAPTSNTALATQVTLTNIPVGGATVTGRKMYRTVVGGLQLKLQSTIANNTTTTITDSTPDGSLGANLPPGDTSGLTQPDGQIVAGATTMIVAGTGAFQAAGGWAVIGNGAQVIRYTGITGSALTGIPASGTGAITATVAYNSTITAAPMLTDIPASGARSINARALTAGDEIYLVVQVDDAAGQSQLASTIGGTGVREEWVQDRRLSIAEARARGQATLGVRPLNARSVAYTCRDMRTASGKTITVNLPAPTSVTGTFKIQQVTISNFRPHTNQYPTYAVQASSVRFSFEDLLRSVKTKE